MEEIIKRALVDEAAMTQLLEDLEPFVYRVAYHFSRNQADAEHIAERVLYGICTKLSTFRGGMTLQNWVYSLVRSAHQEQAAKSDQIQPAPAGRAAPSDTSPGRKLEQLLQDLSEIDRHILVLRFQNGLPVREVAEIVNLPESQVQHRVIGLRDRLRGMQGRGGAVL
jgi:RNA polymerase sigma-70 factor, ECF subfamily